MRRWTRDTVPSSIRLEVQANAAPGAAFRLLLNVPMPYTFELASAVEGPRLMRRLNDLALDQALPIPHELRKRGIRGVAIRISGRDFRIWLDSRSEWASRYALRGRVASLEDQRTIVFARLELGYRAITGPLILTALGAWMLASGTHWGWVMFGVAVLLFIVDESALTRVTPETDPEMRYLCDTLRAIAEVPGEPDIQG